MSQSKNTLQVSIDQPDQMLAMAKDLASFIKEKNLYSMIQGKAFVNVEGWQYAGSRLGIIPTVSEVVNLSTDTELKYSATVTLTNVRTGAQVGSGYALCSNKENGKRAFQEYAVASMAQTRAIGKAYRNLLAWVLKSVGYEPTPAEEMDYMKEAPQSAQAESKTAPTQQDRSDVERITNKPTLEFSRKFKGSTPGQIQMLWELFQEIDADQATIDQAGQLFYDGKCSKSVMSDIIERTQKTKNELKEAEPAKIKHKSEIMLLLTDKSITKEEKNRMIEGINKMTIARAEAAISKLKATIAERSNHKQTA